MTHIYDDPRAQIPPKSGRPEEEQEIDLAVLWQGVRRRLPAILLSSLVLGAGTYFWSRTQPPVYEASASLLSSNTQGQETTGPLNGLGRASPLPDGVVGQVFGSPLVLGKVIEQVRTSPAIQEPERTRLVQALQDDLRMQNMRTISLEANIQPYSQGNGTYTIHARARTPKAAQVLANLSSRALVNWDRSRALEGLRLAQAGFQAQLAQVEQQLTSANAQEREGLVARQAGIRNNLIQIGLFQDSITGVLSQLTSAVQPAAPVAPRPLRNTLIVAGVTLLLGLLYAVLRALLDRTVRHQDDLLNLGIPVFTSVPQLRKQDVLLSGIVRAGRSAGLYEAIGFLRVNLLGAVGHIPHPVLMITSTAPGEGKSTLTATLADGFAGNGQRVLVIDLDLRRGTQGEIWGKYDQSSSWVQLIGEGGGKSSQEALLDPYNVQVRRVQDKVDVLPAGPGLADSMRLLSQANLEAVLTLWRQYYDVVLIDTPPLLALADGLVIGKHVDGVALVVEAGKTTLPDLRAALNRARQRDLKILGAVINRVSTNTYGYKEYSYAPRT